MECQKWIVVSHRQAQVCKNLRRKRQLRDEIQAQARCSDVTNPIRHGTLHNPDVPQHQESRERLPVAAGHLSPWILRRGRKYRTGLRNSSLGQPSAAKNLQKGMLLDVEMDERNPVIIATRLGVAVLSEPVALWSISLDGNSCHVQPCHTQADQPRVTKGAPEPVVAAHVKIFACIGVV